jgi:type I restriction enzyme S subunit
MNNFKKYSAYKDSDLKWLGEIPKHWELVKGKWEWRKENRPIKEDDGIVTAFRDGQVTLRTNRREDGFTIANLEHGYQGVRKGDLVIHGMDAFAGAIGVSDSDGKSTPVYSVCTPKKDSTPFYFSYLLKEMSRTGWIESLAKGIRERSTEFKFPQFSILEYPIPPLPEQTAIANFLDKKTTEIKEFIALKEKTIELLKERKMAIINQAVTKGLDPTVEMKDSGIEWLGEIPRHWEVKPIGTFFKERKEKNIGMKENLVLSLSYGEVKHRIMDNNGLLPESFETYQITYPGDIVFRLTDLQNDKKSLRNGLTKEKGIITSAYLCMYTEKSVNPDFMNLLFRIYDLKKVFYSFGGGIRQGAGYTEMRKIKVIVPTLKEQQEILHKVESFSIEIEKAITTTLKEIELIKEYQQSLISEVVTGKVDVSTSLNSSVRNEKLN